jgi:hypothetical protein
MKFNSTLSLYKILVFTLAFVIGCSADNSFQESCIESRDILLKAKTLLKFVRAENVLGDSGEIESTDIAFDNSETKEYLNEKSKELEQHYQIIKEYFNKNDELYYDSLLLLAFFNDYLYFLSGSEFEDRCKYINKIRDEKEVAISKWIMDDFFGPLLNNEDTINEYLKMDEKEKIRRIHNSIMAPDLEGKAKCS